MTRDAASENQNRAAWPGASVWLSANAGSGKTRVLTDRVARLLLDEVRPQNILCLTYTKAAASEMQNRLFRRLGSWAMKDDAALRGDLTDLGIEGRQDAEQLARARRLFARAIETPGGLRIQTIHSFCAALLRRFPLEAGVTPSFTEMDDRAAALLRAEVIEELADGAGADAVDSVAAEYTGEDFGALARAVADRREAFDSDIGADDIAGWFGLPPGTDESAVLAAAFDGSEAALVAALLPRLAASDKVTDHAAAAKLGAIDLARPDLAALDDVATVLLTGARTNAPFSAKIGSFPTKDIRLGLGELLAPLEAFMQRVETARDLCNRYLAARGTVALHRFAAAFLPAYARRKQRQGWLDFDDLILKTRALLSDRRVADWVLYRLDGELDHILVDEAQDTSPVQWQVIERLAQEFAAGRGARDGRLRTIFVVGDQKQSIYSFQGADPAEFERMRRHFQDRLGAAGAPFQSRELTHSFRSSRAILRFVEALFEGRDGPDLKMSTRHVAFHDALPGRVDLWPAVPAAAAAEPGHWADPVDSRRDAHHDAILARAIADHIAATVGTETIPLQKGGRRAIGAGDFLILVRRRAGLFEEIIRACKAAGLPIAGADRLKLGAELAVKDLAALLRFIATPEDDLSLAAALRSPLFGWTERQLYDLAVGRDGYLWRALQSRADEFAGTEAVLRALRDAADYLRPYDLIERILIRHDGRARLLARLGPEAEDGIDSMLSQSLAYERMEIPSLTGFLTWLETDDVEVKRQLGTASGQIRVMTVHGAKGLESPIVILPDTAKRNAPSDGEVIALANGAPVWRVPAARQPQEMAAALADRRAARAAENLRLLYVAVTRAETWLTICAAGKTGSGDDSWYALAEAALTRTGAARWAMPTGEGLRLVHGDWQADKVVGAAVSTPSAATLPDWALRHAPVAAGPPAVLSPSDLGGAKALPGAEGDGEDAAMRFGRLVHLLLEHLPSVPVARRRAHGTAVLAIGDEPAVGAEAAAALDHAERVLAAPDLAHLFGRAALAEVDVTAALPDLGGARIRGTVDRLIVSPDRVLAVDFKTNAAIPRQPGDVPAGLLRQMGAYAAALRAIYPDRRVDTAILWTAAPRLMPLPHDIVTAALKSPRQLDDPGGRP